MPRVAYFCMEYGLHEEFAIYSGGLGILAGDHLKASADQNLPVVDRVALAAGIYHSTNQC